MKYGKDKIIIEDIISYIENDSECLMPIDRMFNEDGSNITKKEYGHVLLEVLCEELRASGGTIIWGTGPILFLSS